MSYLVFTDYSDKMMKTKRWLISNVRDGSMLGWIKYHAPWRKYVWSMADGVIFDTNCTKEIVEFLEKNKDARN